MKWPWVSREAYDTQEKRIADLRFDLHWQQESYLLLAEKYHALKLQGATIPEPAIPRQQKEIDPLTQAVLQASKGKPLQVRNAMMKKLAEDRKAVEAGLMTEVDVLRLIENGFTPDDGIPE